MLILVGTVPTHSALPTHNAFPTQVAVPPGGTRPDPVRTEIAPGIHLFRTAPYGDIGFDGNLVAIIGSDGVLVFDTNGTPSAAAAVLAEIRKLTSQPVRYVVNSHWHWDHWYGTEVYTPELPRLEKALADGRFFLEQKKAVRHTLPTLTFSRRLTLHLGDREVQVRHHDRAVTPGDAFLYLPKERIVITGTSGPVH
ncbi:MAG: MBL fold metallo-hydrolase [Acidobacteriota bacterium]|nr:MBL fold metallo-hydrolase [Acidobacteriota bacterium]